MIKHLTGRDKSQVKEQILAETPDLAKGLIMLNNCGLLSLSERINMFKRITVEGRMQILKNEFSLNLDKTETEQFTEALTSKRKMQQFYKSLPIEKRYYILNVCTEKFLDDMNIKPKKR